MPYFVECKPAASIWPSGRVAGCLDIKVGNFRLEEFSTRRLETFVTLQVVKIPKHKKPTTGQNKSKKRHHETGHTANGLNKSSNSSGSSTKK